METMKYKDFIGSVEISISDNVLHGKLLHINGLITYEAETPTALETAFREAVDEYLTDCRTRGINLQKTCSGKFNVRIDPEKHRIISSIAQKQHTTINALTQSMR
ncbi:type II toxin-antitoxin system HicB family antitoxin [Pasteurella testudinis]|uniref:type II toxin-antitoxin system HicB family antitoxin n=1 Tax=Pasteurella testudinis TaxID=761 RepID=UPI004059D764